MQIKERSWVADGYRYGFNGMEKDDKVKGDGNSLDFGARIYDSRLGKWLSLDPLKNYYPSSSAYDFVSNSPLIFADKDGKVIWDPVAKKEVIYNSESKKFTYKDGTELSESYSKQALPTLQKLSSSEVGLKMVKSFQEVSTRVIFDTYTAEEEKADKTNSNSHVDPKRDPETGEFLKNDDDLYEEVTITPIFSKIEANAKKDGMSVEEKFIATMTVEWGHIATKEQIALEEKFGLNKIYRNKKAFAKVYNGLLNQAIKNEIAYRKEKGIAIDEGVFQPILRVQKSRIGSKVTFDDENQKAYDDFIKSKNESENDDNSSE